MRNSEYVDSNLTTERFIMPRSAFFRAMTAMYGKKWLAGFGGLLTVGCGVWIITADLRWAIVSLMLLFIIFPMMGAFLYFSHGLRPESFVNIVPHTLSLGEEGLEAVMYRLKDKNDEQEEAKCPGPPPDADGPKEKENENERELEESGRITLPYRKMRPYIVGLHSVTIPAGGGLIWIPMKAFSNKDEMESFISELSHKMRKGTSVD